MKPAIVVYCCANSTAAPEETVERVVGSDQADVAEKGQVDCLLPGGVVECVEIAGRRAAGVGQQQIQAAQLLDGLGHDPFRRVRVAQVAGNPAYHAAGLLADALAGLFQPLWIAAVDHNPCPFTAQFQRGRKT